MKTGRVVGKVILLSVLVTIVTTSSAPVDAQEIFFGSPTNISNNPGTSEDPQIAASGENVYVVWVDTSDLSFDIFFTTIGNNGTSFGTVKNLSNNTGTSVNPQIAASGDNVYVVWEDTSSGSKDIFFTAISSNGTSFGSVTNLSNNSGVSVNPEIAASGDNVYVVWEDSTPGNFDIFFMKITGNGTIFGGKINLSEDSGLSSLPQVAASGDNVYVVWEDSTPGNDDVFFRASNNAGASFGTANNLSMNGGTSEFPEIAASGDNVYVVWEDSTPGNDDVFFRASNNAGASFGTANNLSDDVTSSLRPQTNAIGDRTYVVWQDISSDFDVFFIGISNNGTSFGSVTNLSNNSGVSSFPQLASAGENVYVVWQQHSSLPEISFISGTTFNPDFDGDGISNIIDTLPMNTSNDFSDMDLNGGMTNGTILDRGDQVLMITEEPNPSGIRIKADPSGGPGGAFISICGGAAQLLLTPGDEVIVTCGDAITVQVINGTVDVTFFSTSGNQLTASITGGNTLIFDPDTITFTAPSSNNQTIIIFMDGQQFSIAPGQTVQVFPGVEVIKGDANLDNNVNVLDMIAVSKHVLGIQLLGDAQRFAADVSPEAAGGEPCGDGLIDMEDLNVIGSAVVSENAISFLIDFCMPEAA